MKFLRTIYLNFTVKTRPIIYILSDFYDLLEYFSVNGFENKT